MHQDFSLTNSQREPFLQVYYKHSLLMAMQVPLFTHTLVMDAGSQALSVYVYLKSTIDD